MTPQRAWCVLPSCFDRSTLFPMTTVAEISGAVRRLPKRDLARFRKWFMEYEAAAWDRQFDRDVATARRSRGPQGASSRTYNRAVTHRATPRFWRCYQRLPQQVRQLQAKNESKAVLDVFEELASRPARFIRKSRSTVMTCETFATCRARATGSAGGAASAAGDCPRIRRRRSNGRSPFDLGA